MDYTYFSTPQQPYDHFRYPVPHTETAENTQLYDALDFDPSYYAFSAPPTPRQSSPNTSLASMAAHSVDSGLGGDVDDGRTRSSSSGEDKGPDEGPTPAQSRRKAQNRAAQRAFRTRKEQHVKTVESQLSILEANTAALNEDNARLKDALLKAQMENDVLRATTTTTSTAPRDSPIHQQQQHHADADMDAEYDTEYSIQPLTNGSVVRTSSTNTQHNDEQTTNTNLHMKQVFSAQQAWDRIQSHTLVQQGIVDIADVSERLKRRARCDGRGPVFEEGDILWAVEGARRETDGRL